jgi:hypothetical protein
MAMGTILPRAVMPVKAGLHGLDLQIVGDGDTAS